MKPIIMPRSLENGSNALRMLDHFKYTPKEASLLFEAVHQISVDAEGRDIFSMLEHHLEALLILEKHELLKSVEWQGVIKDTNDCIEALLMQLGERVRPTKPGNGFRMSVEYAA